MKRLLLALPLLLAAPTFAQDETLFGADTLSFGGYGAVDVRFTPVRGEFGMLVGGYGGFLLNHSFMIGAGGYGLVNDVKASQAAYDYYKPTYDLFLEFGYGGFMMQYTCMPHRLVHCNAGILIGGGAVTYRYAMGNEDWSWMNQQDWSSKTDVFFVVEPSLQVEMNVTPWMRMDIGGSYRFITGVGALVDLRNSDLRGASGGITFKFGKF